MEPQAIVKRLLVLIPLVVLAAGLAQSTASAQTGRYALLSFGIGGEQSSGVGYSLVAHITQPDETMRGGVYEASGEFQAVAAAINHQIYLPIMLKNR